MEKNVMRFFVFFGDGPAGRSLDSPRFGELAICLPPRSLKKPRPKEERAFLVPKLPSLALGGDEESGDI
ncbi:hypothetical protein EYF80_028486 [Liparis tanakae]|uniref:Uncharacterized protein n=1 Tax=Liparis tanakae TaxID=230148 RepID=A0A4Z2H8D2_9TELE|nr:hypothetical protein EYF80_028486 [Liparis tanakae]